MSTGLFLGTTISLVLASYLAALNLAMLDFSRTALQRRLESKGKAHKGKNKLTIESLEAAAIDTLNRLLKDENVKIQLEAAKFLLANKMRNSDGARRDRGLLEDIDFTWFD